MCMKRLFSEEFPKIVDLMDFSPLARTLGSFILFVFIFRKQDVYVEREMLTGKILRLPFDLVLMGDLVLLQLSTSAVFFHLMINKLMFMFEELII